MSEGKKYDSGKLRMDLVPADSLRKLAEVYTFGAQKYADENWREGIAWKRIYGAVLRHLTSWYLGEEKDPESGLPHLSHAAWGLFTLLNYTDTHPELDNRPIPHVSGDCNPPQDVKDGLPQQSSHSEVPKGKGAVVCEESAYQTGIGYKNQPDGHHADDSESERISWEHPVNWSR